MAPAPPVSERPPSPPSRASEAPGASIVRQIEALKPSRGRAIGVGLALAASVVGVLVWLGLRPRPQLHIAEVEIGASWSTGYLVIPDRAQSEAPEQPLGPRLSRIAAGVADTQVRREPPLRAFGADALRAELEAVLTQADDRALLSIHVRDLDSGRVLFDYNGDALLIPASNHKIVTVAAALDLLGPEFEFETSIVLIGDALYLIGGGDPSIDGEALDAMAHAVADRVGVGALRTIIVDDSAFSAQTLGPGYQESMLGVSYKAPSGALSLNFNTVEVRTYPIVGRRLPGVTLEPQSAHLMVLNRARTRTGPTRLDVRTRPLYADGDMDVDLDGRDRSRQRTVIEIRGQVSSRGVGHQERRRIVDPGMFTGGAFSEMLAAASQSEALPVEAGLAPAWVRGAAGRAELEGDALGHDEIWDLPRLLGSDPVLGDVELVALRRSPPLIDIARGLLTYSNNFTAEQLLRTVGWHMSGEPGDWENGVEAVRGYWEALGNDPQALVFENGSGLSRRGRVTTEGLVELLSLAYATQARGSSLIDALPVAGAGTEGTLASRLPRSGQRVRAKTGTMDGVSGLTGVITSEAGEAQVAFSILTNVREGDHMAASARRATEDQIVMAVLAHIDSWEAVRGTLISGLPALDVRPAELGDAELSDSRGVLPGPG